MANAPDRIRNVPIAPGRALDFVNRVERMRWVPRSIVRYLMRRYVNLHCLPEHKAKLLSVSGGDVVIDLGANVGLFSMYFAERSAIVHAFEPDPYAFKILSNHARPFKKLRLHQKAVFDKPGEMKLYRHKQFDSDANYAQSSTLMAEKRNVSDSSTISVPVVDIGDFMRSIEGRIKLIKIDVEGAEAAILNRLIDTGDLERVDYVLVETHEDVVPGLREELDKLKRRLKENGYSQVDFSWY